MNRFGQKEASQLAIRSSGTCVAQVGVVSLNDIVPAADTDPTIRSEDVVAALRAICGHHHPVPHVVAA